MPFTALVAMIVFRSGRTSSGHVKDMFHLIQIKKNLSTDEEFKVAAATECEDVLAYWKELPNPIQGDICGPPAEDGMFFLIFVYVFPFFICAILLA